MTMTLRDLAMAATKGGLDAREVGEALGMLAPYSSSLDDPITRQFASPAGLRDYFIAHAPVEPPGWFNPVMPGERPKHPDLPANSGATAREIEYVREYWQVMPVAEIKNGALLEYVTARREAYQAAAKWDFEHRKQRSLQWPLAWADEMLRRRLA